MKRENPIKISMSEVREYSKITGRYIPALYEVLARRVTVKEAKKNGIMVTIQELQKATDAFRQSKGLVKAGDTHHWLDSIGITLEAFENYQETNVFIEKFMDIFFKKAQIKTISMVAPEDYESVRERIYRDWLKEQLGKT